MDEVIFVLCGVKSALRKYKVHLHKKMRRNKAVMESMLDVLLDNSPKEVAKMSKFLNSIKNEVDQQKNA